MLAEAALRGGERGTAAGAFVTGYSPLGLGKFVDCPAISSREGRNSGSGFTTRPSG